MLAALHGYAHKIGENVERARQVQAGLLPVHQQLCVAGHRRKMEVLAGSMDGVPDTARLWLLQATQRWHWFECKSTQTMLPPPLPPLPPPPYHNLQVPLPLRVGARMPHATCMVYHDITMPDAANCSSVRSSDDPILLILMPPGSTCVLIHQT